MYLAGQNLPDVTLDSVTDSEYRLSDQDYRKITSNLSKKVGSKNQFYFETFDPIYPTDNEPTQGWLVDDLADIYRDVKSELIEIDKGTDVVIANALFILKLGFQTHWGGHAIDALRALHYLVLDHGAKDD